MKKILTFMIATCTFVASHAITYPYLILETTNGESFTLPASGLTITFSNGQLVASDGTQIALSSLSKMFFSDTQGIETTILPSSLTGSVEVYTVSGKAIGTYNDARTALTHLSHGVYILKDQRNQPIKVVS